MDEIKKKYLNKAIAGGKRYIARVKETVPARYWGFANTNLYWIVWAKFMARGNIAVKGGTIMKVGVFEYTFYILRHG